MNTIAPSVWGPHYWAVFHFYAEIYPNVPSKLAQDAAIAYIKVIPFTLPCSACADHAFDYINKKLLTDHNLKFATSSNKNLVDFFRKFHNSVNHRLGKKQVRF